MEASSQLILLGGLLLTLSVFAGVVSARLGAPLLLAFLGLGMLSGEDGLGKIAFSDFRIAYLIGSGALVIILFDGGISTNWSAVRKLALPSALLATVGVAITAGIVAAGMHYGFHLPWLEAILLGTVVAPTDVAAVVSSLHMQKLRLRARVAGILELESGLNDPTTVFVTVLLVQIMRQPVFPSTGSILGFFSLQLFGGIVIGILGGKFLLFLFRRLDLNAGLYPILGLAGALTVFGGAQVLGSSGFMATYLAAIVLGNGRYSGKQAVSRFFGSFAWLSQIVLFLMLGLLVTPSRLSPMLGSAFGAAALLIFVARPAAVALCLIPFRLKWREIVFISWVGLRGAVPIFLAIIPVLAGARGGILVFGTAFIVVMVSLVIQGWTVAPFARWLRLDVPGAATPLRLDLELPESLTKSGNVVGYRLAENSAATGYKPAELPLPAGNDIVLTIRDGVAHGREMTSALAPDDYVLVWSNPKDITVLDGLFGPGDDRTGASPTGIFGEFAFPATTSLAAILSLYDQKPLRKKSDIPVAQYLKAQIGAPSIGDRMRVRGIELIVREIEEGEVTSVGVEVDPAGARSRRFKWA
jgi:cell volume regulation protein A